MFLKNPACFGQLHLLVFRALLHFFSGGAVHVDFLMQNIYQLPNALHIGFLHGFETGWGNQNTSCGTSVLSPQVSLANKCMDDQSSLNHVGTLFLHVFNLFLINIQQKCISL